jgi:hypothetical protein
MSLSLTSNPAVLNPQKILSPAQRDALVTIGFYRSQKRQPNGKIGVGQKQFSAHTIAALESMQLLRGKVPALAPTTAGQLAIERLKGPKP